MDEKVAIRALKQIKEVFDKHGIEYWLDLGTLLGAVRDGKFISWDIDIDLGTWRTQIDKINVASSELCVKGFEVLIGEWGSNFYILKKNCKIGVTLYRLSGNKALHLWLVHNKMGKPKRMIGDSLDYLHRVLSEKRHLVENSRMPAFITKNLYKIVNKFSPSLRSQLAKIVWIMYEKIGFVIHLAIPSYYFKNLSTILFYETEFKVPSKKEEYLFFRYGKNWKIPKKNYTYWKEDGAICC